MSEFVRRDSTPFFALIWTNFSIGVAGHTLLICAQNTATLSPKAQSLRGFSLLLVGTLQSHYPKVIAFHLFQPHNHPLIISSNNELCECNSRYEKSEGICRSYNLKPQPLVGNISAHLKTVCPSSFLRKDLVGYMFRITTHLPQVGIFRAKKVPSFIRISFLFYLLLYSITHQATASCHQHHFLLSTAAHL